MESNCESNWEIYLYVSIEENEVIGMLYKKLTNK